MVQIEINESLSEQIKAIVESGDVRYRDIDQFVNIAVLEKIEDYFRNVAPQDYSEEESNETIEEDATLSQI